MFNHENQQFLGVLLIAETGGSLFGIFYKKNWNLQLSDSERINWNWWLLKKNKSPPNTGINTSF